MKVQWCPFCSKELTSKSLPKDVYQCSECRRKVRIEVLGKTIKIKELWRHVGGGTMIAGNNAYPSDDTYAKGKSEITIQCTSNRHFNLPYQVDSLEELLKLDGIDPESKREIKKLLS